MRGRQVCWSDPRLQALAKKFIPVCDEVWRLHNLQELDCRYFQGFCEEGHYGGPNRQTRQGIYVHTPSGRFLGSVNTTDPRRMERMLDEALDRWKAMPKKDRYLDYDPATRREAIQRRERQYPADGLPLRVYTRDIDARGGPRKDVPDDWRGTAWNVDSLWYRKDEARALLPGRLAKGRSIEWPAALAQRMVRHNLVDNVRGQTNGYSAAQVRTARIRSEVVSVKKQLVTVRFEGETLAHTTSAWPKDGATASVAGGDAFARGVRTRLAGEAVYDKKAGAFTSFRLAAVGSRFGRTRYNFREEDVDERPIAFAIIFDPDDPGRRVAPAEMGAYGW